MMITRTLNLTNESSVALCSVGRSVNEIPTVLLLWVIGFVVPREIIFRAKVFST